MPRTVSLRARRQRFVILQPVKLAGQERAGGDGRAHDHFDDVGRQANHIVHRGAQFVVEFARSARRARARRRKPREHARHHRIALLGAGHGLDHIAGERWVQIAEEADGAAVGTQRHEHVDGMRFGDALGLHGLTRLVERLEVAAIEDDVVLVFAGENGVGLGTGGDKDGAGRKVTVPPVAPSLPVDSSH